MADRQSVDGDQLSKRAPGGDGRYAIRIGGQLDPGWSEWLGGLEIVWDAHGDTTLCGYVADQSALHGILTNVRDLGVRLIAVEQID